MKEKKDTKETSLKDTSVKDTSVKENKETKIPTLETKVNNEMLISVKGENSDRIYKFYMPFNSPLPECYTAAINVANEIAKIFNETIEKQKQALKDKSTDNPVDWTYNQPL